MSIDRGSTTISFAPRRRAFLMRSAAIGCDSLVFDPMISTASAVSRSSNELVIAPLPSDWRRPVTVEAWQSRAQWSTLWVPITARMNFWKR